MAWINVKGRTTPVKTKVGELEYVAPSWSWASVQASVQPRLIFDSSRRFLPLVRARAAEVSLRTENVFGPIKAGWLRIQGCLNPVQATGFDRAVDLIDEAAGEALGFCADTAEAYELVKSKRHIGKIFWMPLTLRFGLGS